MYTISLIADFPINLLQIGNGCDDSASSDKRSGLQQLVEISVANDVSIWGKVCCRTSFFGLSSFLMLYAILVNDMNDNEFCNQWTDLFHMIWLPLPQVLRNFMSALILLFMVIDSLKVATTCSGSDKLNGPDC